MSARTRIPVHFTEVRRSLLARMHLDLKLTSYVLETAKVGLWECSP